MKCLLLSSNLNQLILGQELGILPGLDSLHNLLVVERIFRKSEVQIAQPKDVAEIGCNRLITFPDKNSDNILVVEDIGSVLLTIVGVGFNDCVVLLNPVLKQVIMC